jgi:eukaryotic-like serine/threonine-protein kinase
MDQAINQTIEPRTATPMPGGPTSRNAGGLPDDLMSEQVQRLAAFAAVTGGLWSVGLVMDFVTASLTGSAAVPTSAIVIEVFAISASVGLFLYARYASHGPCLKTDAGLVFMLLNAMDIALLNSWVVAPKAAMMGHLSWNTIVILVTAMILPTTTPRKMLAASIAAASMDPLGVWIAHLRGMPVPSALNTMLFFMPNYSCAVVATVPSHLLQHMGRKLRHAQAMGSYRLVELLGRGGMGEVWRAEHRLLARNAAIKLIRPEVLGSSGERETRTMLRRFEREAQATAALSSPHTIRVFDFGATRDRTFYYVMELLAGRDLESLVREFGPLPADRTVYLLRQACHSLADAHARGLVHRDIKPANIYVCRMGLDYDFVKVLDFGLVTFNDKTAVNQTLLTSEHTTTGTPAFMAPEIILGESEVDRRADVYSVGCVAYYLLTGQLVFDADTTMKMFLHHVQTPPIPPSQRTELPIPRELDELVLACLEKDPNRRPQDATQLFEMACGCRSGESWNTAKAKSWWETHLLELTGPLTVSATRPDTFDNAPVVIQ